MPHFLQPNKGANITPQPHVITLIHPQHLVQQINYGALHLNISQTVNIRSLGNFSSIFSTVIIISFYGNYGKSNT